MRKLGAFLSAVARQWKTALTGALMTFTGLGWQFITWISPTTSIPNAWAWLLWIPGIVVTLGASFAAWREESDRADRAEVELRNIDETGPRVVFREVRHTDVTLAPPHGREIEVWQLWFRNEPRIYVASATVQKMTAEVTFRDSKFQPLLAFIGQWAITQMPGHVGWTTIRSAIDLPAGHTWAKLLLASQSDISVFTWASTSKDGEAPQREERFVYGLAGENLHHDPTQAAHDAYRIPDTVSLVTVTLAGQNMRPQVYAFGLVRETNGAIESIEYLGGQLDEPARVEMLE